VEAGRAVAGTSWDQVAAWYDGWVGQEGSTYHRALAVPAALDLLALQRGEAVLDVGCGQGVLAEPVTAAGATYTGIDASPRLIAAARRRHGELGRFLEVDARRLHTHREVAARRYDAVVLLLSIQDMDPLADVLGAVSTVAADRSRVVLVMTHPAYRQPRHAGWGYDEGRKLTYRRVDAYLTPMAVPMKSLAGGPATRSFHRPISAYVNELARAGFVTDAMLELPDLPPDQRPRRGAPKGGVDAARAGQEIPLFLALRGVRG
jgi:SAM-dependent methyltransferase